MMSSWRYSNYRFAAGLMLFAIGCVLLLHLDPGNSMWGFITSPVVKYAPSMIAVLAMIPVFLSGCLVLRNPWGFLSFFVIWMVMAVGGLKALALSGEVEHTYLGRVLYLAPAFPAYFITSQSQFSDVLFKRVMVLLTVYGLMASLLSIMHCIGIRFVALEYIYHEEVVLFPAATAAIYFVVRGPMRHILALFMVAGMIMTRKNTGFLMAAATLFMMGNIWMTFIARRNFGFRLLLKSGIAIALSVAGIIAWIFRESLPHGSPGVRLVTYTSRLDEFMDSPWVGDMYSGNPLLTLVTSYGSLQVPSHSDFLDILSAGGIVGVLLLFLPVVRSIRLFLMSETKEVASILSVVIVISFLVTMAVNPIMNQPLALFFCMGYGFLICQHASQRAVVVRI